MFPLEIRAEDLKCLCFSPAKFQLFHELVILLFQFSGFILQLKNGLLFVNYFPCQLFIPIFTQNVIPVQFLHLLALFKNLIFGLLLKPSLQYDFFLFNDVLNCHLLFLLVSLLLLQHLAEVISKMASFILLVSSSFFFFTLFNSCHRVVLVSTSHHCQVVHLSILLVFLNQIQSRL
jgi:hypothetical protein